MLCEDHILMLERVNTCFKLFCVARMGEICLLVLICQVLVCILQGTISRRFCY